MVLKRSRIAKQYQRQFQQVACQAKRATRDGVQALVGLAAARATSPPEPHPRAAQWLAGPKIRPRGAVGKEGFPPKFRRGAAPNLLQIMRVFWNREGIF